MSKGKKGKEVSKGAGAGQKWDEQLIQEQIDTDSWRLCVSVLAGEEAGSEEMVSALCRQINLPSGDFRQRRRFYSLSQQEVLKKALEGGTGAMSKSQASKGKGKGAPSPGVALGSKPPGAEALADLVKSQSGSEEGVGPDTLARAIKFCLLLLRQEDLVRRQQDAIKEGRPGSGAATPSKKKAAKQAKGAKGSGTEEAIPMPSKPESTMRKRGEEVVEICFIEDEPPQGPEAYLLLSGVRCPDVIAEMGRVGIAPSCLLKVRAGERGENGETEEEDREKRKRIDESLGELWRGADKLLETKRDSGVRDTGVLLVEYKEEPGQERVQGLFDQVAGQIYQLVDQKRQHKQYIDSLSLADVTQARTAKREGKGDQLYREQLGVVPNQCCSVALLMESLLQQVCVSDVTSVISVGETGQDMSPALQESLTRIKNKVDTGGNKVTERGSVPEKRLSYPVIYEGDRICERDSLLEPSSPGLAKRGVEKRMLENFRVAQLLKRFPQLGQDERARTDARYQQLQRLATQSPNAPISPSQLQALLIMLSFAEMVDSPSPQLFDDPYPDRDRRGALSRLTPVIANLQSSEPLGRDVISQRIEEALSPDKGYPTCLIRYHRQSDKLLILLHPELRRSEWNARMLTPTGFYLFQRFLHSRVSPLVERVFQVNSSDRDKLLGAQDLTPTPSQVSLTQLSAVSGEKGKEGRGSSLNKSGTRNSRTSRLKSSSRVSSPSVDRIRDRETSSSSREDLLAAQRSEVEQKLLLLTGYDVGDEWYAGRGSDRKVQLSEREFLSAEERDFYASPLSSISMQYSHLSGLSAGISLLIDRAPRNLSTGSSDSEDDVIKPATVPEPPAPLLYASYRVRLPSGLLLSLSPYGRLGGLQLPKQMVEGNEIRQREEEQDRSPSPSMAPMTSESKLGGKGRGKKTDDQLAAEQQRQLTEERERRKREIERVREERVLTFKRKNKYQTLFASAEYGLQVTCSSKVDLLSDVTLRDGSDGSLRVTQCYPNAPSATQPCDKLRLYPASLEASRSYLEDGTVIKLMKDSSAQVLWPDGSSARSLWEGELEQLNRHPPDLTALSTHPHNNSLLSLISSKETEFSLADKQWMYTDRQGQRFVYRWTVESESEERTENEPGKEGQEFEASTDKLPLNKFSASLYKEPLLKCWQTDPVSGEEMVTREDQVLAVFRKEGTRIVHFSDGTRITSYNNQPSIQVECPGYAKVRFSTPSSGYATITLVEGNEIIADRRGAYSVTSNDVTCSFSQEGRVSLSLSHESQVDMSVSGRGDWISYKQRCSGREHAINEQFETYESNTGDVSEESAVQLSPRMFVLSRDGSGLELLSREYAQQELARWKEREGVLLQSHALPGDANVIIHSAVSPIATPCHKVSHLAYTEEEIVPVHLRTQYYIPIDLNRYRDKSGVFGASVGRGLQIGSSTGMTDNNRRLVPRAFRRRELLEHRPIGQSALDAFVSSLEGVNAWWEETKRERELFSPVELRTDSVLEQAQDLFSLFSSSHLEDNDVVIQEYKEAILVPRPLEKARASVERRPEREEADKVELESFKANLVALRNRDIPGYFASESGQQFLLQERSLPPDMQRLTEELPLAMRRGTDPEGGDAPPAVPAKPERLINPRLSELSQETGPLTTAYASTTIILPDNSGSTVSLTNRDRPNNPSPQVTTSADPSLATTEDSPAHSPSKQAEGVAAGRPQKPTPLVAGSEVHSPIPDYLFYNVAGIPRTAPVRLPNSLKALRPGDKQCEQLDETKRQTSTASLSMPLCKGLKQGISLLETEVDFGMLKEGCTYSYTLQVKNTGTTSTRFKIKPPLPSTGMKASYSPHPIAAGMSASIRIELFAAPEGQGQGQHSLEIVSEVNSLLLPVTATVLAVDTYEGAAGLTLAKGVSLVLTKATSATASQRL